LSELIVPAMSVLKALTVMVDGTPGFVADELPAGVEVLPQAAATRAAAPTKLSLLAFENFWDPRPLTASCNRIRALSSTGNPLSATPSAPVATSVATQLL
jgi:hypothetical protein